MKPSRSVNVLNRRWRQFFTISLRKISSWIASNGSKFWYIYCWHSFLLYSLYMAFILDTVFMLELSLSMRYTFFLNFWCFQVEMNVEIQGFLCFSKKQIWQQKETYFYGACQFYNRLTSKNILQHFHTISLST